MQSRMPFVSAGRNKRRGAHASIFVAATNRQADKQTGERVEKSFRISARIFSQNFRRKLHVRRRERLAARRCFYFDRRLVEQRLIALLRYLRSEQSRSHTAICAIAVALVGATIHAQSAWIIKPVKGGRGPRLQQLAFSISSRLLVKVLPTRGYASHLPRLAFSPFHPLSCASCSRFMFSARFFERVVNLC